MIPNTDREPHMPLKDKSNPPSEQSRIPGKDALQFLLNSSIILLSLLFSEGCLLGGERNPLLLNLFSLDSAPLSDFQYPVSSYRYTKYVTMPTFRPSINGTAEEYSIEPALPPGLNFDSTTGSISGVPTANLTSTTFTITARNSEGTISTTLVLSSTSSQWIEGAFIKAANSDIADYYGNALALDGDTLVVGAYLECSNQTTVTNGAGASTDNSADSSGAVYVYRRSGAGWEQEAYIKAPNAEANDSFGYTVAISGNTIVVGAYLESSSQTTITNGTTASADNSSPAAGAAYVFRRTGTTWAQEAYLKASNAENSDYFGYSLAISGDTIAIGAMGESSNQTAITNGTTASADNTNASSGAVYVYKRIGTNWNQEAYIKAANGDAADLFGISVGLSGNTLVVGAAQESSNQITITNGTTASANNAKASAGAAYVYVRTGTIWAQEAYLKANNGQSGDQFGTTVAVDGDTVAVGSIYSNEGAVYVFTRTGTLWSQETVIQPANPASITNFGSSVSISGNTIAVGTYSEDGNENSILNGTNASLDNTLPASGATYIYQRTGTTWAQESYIKAPNVQAGDWFGMAVALSGDTVAVGAPQEDGGQTAVTIGGVRSWNELKPNSGAAYVFTR
ncbi:hypothetical protein EHQ12_10195 [Leptospira gomenensis]|uniref:Integrin n=1 Tax=Leptospira gomenensis TaxID=2484974 RepID=A0A5F1YCF1_9LEPT|nr:putative Ig domain-containing protein [Leptospira gomenensis]TGK34607.1 hypothetical protein EHQ17_09340 [Leptospira gomenensis]TGK38586.1 hypothetical protein EHQ12_10195 [Leptospira gomenensis]TGK51096.1 hypothetical protein EHQ07_04375 [Leptospira gomenensis]TGK68263.1 hypothetical protein EHQ13_00520 [Leptospira gomenensis]